MEPGIDQSATWSRPGRSGPARRGRRGPPASPGPRRGRRDSGPSRGPGGVGGRRRPCRLRVESSERATSIIWPNRGPPGGGRLPRGPAGRYADQPEKSGARSMDRRDRPTAVVLLSGGLDSATALAEADGRRLRPVCPDDPLRPEARRRARRRPPGRAGVGRRPARRADDRPPGLRRQRPDGRARRAEGPRPGGRWPRASRSPTSRPGTRSSSPCALAWAESLGAFDLFVGVNCVDYSGYPDCRPEFLRGLRDAGEPRDEGGRRGGRTFPRPRPPDPPDQGADHRPRPGARRRLRPDATAATTRPPRGSPAGVATPAGSAWPPSPSWGRRTLPRDAAQG